MSSIHCQKVFVPFEIISSFLHSNLILLFAFFLFLLGYLLFVKGVCACFLYYLCHLHQLILAFIMQFNGSSFEKHQKVSFLSIDPSQSLPCLDANAKWANKQLQLSFSRPPGLSILHCFLRNLCYFILRYPMYNPTSYLLLFSYHL